MKTTMGVVTAAYLEKIEEIELLPNDGNCFLWAIEFFFDGSKHPKNGKCIFCQ